jgi:putative tricarboxylic transport membrane protein
MEGLLLGFSTALAPTNLLLCLLGAILGTLIGVLPGLGPTATIALILPLTLEMDPIGALILMAGVYYGASYGGSTTAILVNVPGEAQSVVTCLDGHPMARQGRAGAALTLAAVGSFVAGTLGTIALSLVAVPLAGWAVRFGPPEYFALMLAGLVLCSVLGQGGIARNLAMVVLGVALSQIGLDSVTGEERFTGGILELQDGIQIVTLAMGLFGVSEILLLLETSARGSAFARKIGSLWPTRAEWRQSTGAIARGSILGFLIGLIPGGGAVLASFVAYLVEKRISRIPEMFGHGAPAGVAGPEAANNAGATGAFVPLLTLGLPSNSVMALMLGALILYGVAPGPLLMQQRPDLFWGVIASMYIGNVMLIVLNLPLIGIWVKILKIPSSYLLPALLLFTIVGTYSIRNSAFDLYLLLGCGVGGYFLRKLGFELGPLVLAFVIGDRIEATFRQSLMMGRGSFAIFLDRPVALAMIVLVGVVLVLAVARGARRLRGEMAKFRDG